MRVLFSLAATAAILIPAAASAQILGGGAGGSLGGGIGSTLGSTTGTVTGSIDTQVRGDPLDRGTRSTVDAASDPGVSTGATVRAGGTANASRRSTRTSGNAGGSINADASDASVNAGADADAETNPHR